MNTGQGYIFVSERRGEGSLSAVTCNLLCCEYSGGSCGASSKKASDQSYEPCDSTFLQSSAALVDTLQQSWGG